jgi:NAD(P)H-flavin reductase/NAD-dependent dihydropyrimidine dehydrogenase PreA subunit
MVVKTSSPQIVELRKEVLRLMLSGHTSPCLVCKHREPCEKYRPRSFKAGRATRCVFCNNRFSCELRMLADEYKIEDLNLPVLYKHLPLERSDPFLDRDYNLCILCGRCARICEKIHGKGTIDFINRGKEARIGTAFHKPHLETNCRFCGACIDICPTGSLSDRFAKWYGAPDRTQDSTCLLCPNGCAIRLRLKDGKAIGSGMTGFRREDRICAVGRFALPQILDNPNRLTSHQIRVPDGLIKTSYEEALSEAAKRLGSSGGESFALLAHGAATREEIYVLRKFVREVMKSPHFAVAKGEGGGLVMEPASVAEAIAKGTVKAVYSLGPFVSPESRKGIETLVVADLFPSDTARSADVVIAASALVETEGTFLNAAGRIQTLTAASVPPAGLLPDWKILCDLAKQMGAAGFDYASVAEIQSEMEGKNLQEQPPAAPAPSPLEDVRAIPRAYRGHRLSEVVCALRGLLGEPVEAPERAAEAAAGEKPFRILGKVELVPNTHMVTVHAPVIAEKCLPGQFVIAMVNETSERIPYTISDFDREKGTVTLVILEVGRSSREMAETRAGQHLAHVAGPLGLPVEVKKYGTVVCAGGCFGVGAILPIARAMKEAGNRVICIEEAASHYLLHWQEKLSGACDELVIVTKDGSAGIQGGVQEAIRALVERGEKIDQSYIIGCTFMMMLVSEQNKTLGIPTQTAMNPVMLDGTGMCGACRVSLGGSTKFACVDGPFLDGLEINWIELIQRQAAFKREEIEGMPQEPAVEHAHGHAHACMQA